MVLSDSSSPLYIQLIDYLRSAVSSGSYLPGQRIPSEIELCKEYGVSRITVRRAVSELVEEGLLEKKQGKGVYVAQPKNVIHAMAIDGFSGFSKLAVGNVRVVVLDKKKRQPTVKEARLFEIPIDGMVCELARVLYVNETPMMYDRSIFSEKKFPGMLERVEDNTSTYKLMAEVYGYDNVRVEKEISMTFAHPKEDEILHCKMGETLFYIEKIAYDSKRKVNHLSKLLSVASRTKFTLTYEK